MKLIHHVVTGDARPPVVLVHGFGCSHTDWAAQVTHLSPRHRTVAVDLRGHGVTPGEAGACSIERYGADVAAVMQTLDLAQAVLVGHSMGCRVVTEAALQAPERTAGVVLVDGSQFSAVMTPVLRERFAQPDGYATLRDGMFQEMFTAKTHPDIAAAVIARARQLPQAIGEKMLSDMLRYDLDRFTTALGQLTVPVLAIQTTYANERRERRPLGPDQTTPYLDMLRNTVPSLQIEILLNTGHFPQLDESARTNTLIERFVQRFAA